MPLQDDFDYSLLIESAIDAAILKMGPKTLLRDACEYSLKSGGKRFRPLLVCLIAEALGQSFSVLEAALSVEFFHTASLIVDDLPCMDNDDERRGQLTCHKMYNESIALLASYSLITLAFEKIHTSSVMMKKEGALDAEVRGMRALQEASLCAGILGATTGQFYDLYPPEVSLETIYLTAYQKTGTLFDITFVLGWIFGGGDLERLPEVKACAYHLGIAFQMADDLTDLSTDKKNLHGMNFAVILGKDACVSAFKEELSKAKTYLIELNLNTPCMQKMYHKLYDLGLK
ncbi:MAG: polyprenyl synthetase family protein [Candidatus Rhabdochlamydia sp.]